MNAERQHIKTGENKEKWLGLTQLILFVSAIIVLSVLNLFYISVEIRRPIILMTASIFVLFNFKKIREILIVQKIVLLYIIEMFFSQLSGRFVHIRSVSIDMSLLAMAPLAVSFICSKFRKSQPISAEASDLLKSWGIVFAGMILHMLFLFLLLKNIYGYGYDHNFAVLANMCLYFLVFFFSWQQLEDIYLRSITAMVLVVFFIIIMANGL